MSANDPKLISHIPAVFHFFIIEFLVIICFYIFGILYIFINLLFVLKMKNYKDVEQIPSSLRFHCN